MCHFPIGKSSRHPAGLTFSSAYQVSTLSFALLFTLAAQMGGFGLSGLSRRLLVWPASMIWPYNLVITTSLNTLHAGNDPSSKSISRFKFFMIALGCTFVYHFFPGKSTSELFRKRYERCLIAFINIGYIMSCLSYFSWICWIKPGALAIRRFRSA